ncbi:MAG: MFS transporter, UMF1 family [Bacteroidetes bacterium]|nr:MAG: MFS transporter, UMF1 family [Bacteroidota bacterium]
MIQKGDKRIIRAWTFYDWANSVYPLVISSAIFPIMYEKMTSIKDKVTGVTIYDQVSFFGINFKNTEFYAYLVSLSYITVAIIAPILSGIADYSGNKKRFLQFFCFLGAISSSLLYFFHPDNGGQDFTPYHLGITILPLFFASVGYWGSLVYYNAYLPEIAEPADHDKISARGFSMGYFGSALLLIAILVLTQFTGIIKDIHWAFPMVGAWWIGFAFVTFRRLPNNVYNRNVEGNVLKNGYRELVKVWKDIKTRLQLRRYLASYFMFNMAVQTVMIMATAFANKEVRGIKTQDLIISILLIQFLAIGGAFIFSKLSSRFGNLRTLAIAIVIWIFLCIGVYFLVYLPWQFYIAAAVVGLVMGGIQALARSTYSKMLPETQDHASYFSFFDMSEKIGLAVGTFSFGLIEGLADIRTSVLALVVFFMLGFVLLLRVPKTEMVK